MYAETPARIASRMGWSPASSLNMTTGRGAAAFITASCSSTSRLGDSVSISTTSAGVAQDVVVWRAGLKPRFRLAVDGEVGAVMALLRGESLDQALSLAPQLDFALWLPMAVQSGLLLSVQVLPGGLGSTAA